MWPVRAIKNIKVQEHQSASPVFRSNAKGSLRVDLSTRLAIIEPVVELIGRLPRRSTIAGSWMRSSVNLGPTRRERGRRRGGNSKLW